MSLSKEFRYYQTEADNAIYEELLTNDKCIVKMFCGTGKSRLMRYCRNVENKNLVVYVFPSLSLIKQFYEEYLDNFGYENVLKVSSENEYESTTDPKQIVQFLVKPTNKIICITYQSFETLLDNLGELIIDVCIFDEAHHAVGEKCQKLVFERSYSCEKQIFLTATPKNTNGIIMYDREKPNDGNCGRLVYDYSYLRGLNEQYLNAFDILIDMYLDNTNRSVYETIARSILTTGNNRVLTFHADVNTDRDTSVRNFVDEKEFIAAFKKVLKEEFPTCKKYKKTKIKMIGLYSEIVSETRSEILKEFDKTPNDEIFIISSCETIGEGIDTKNANMCVFVDPKTSYVKIIQNIGLVVRKQEDTPKSSILIPCWVDRTKYLECNGDREKCDEVIRQDMSEGGNFNGILNVLSALKQEDEELYDICLHYPDTFSPQEIKINLEKQGFVIDDMIGSREEIIEHLLDIEITDYDNEFDTDEDFFENVAEENDVCIEIHTNSLENPVKKYNEECESGEIIRIYKNEVNNEDDEYDENDEYDEYDEDIYQPIVKKEGRQKRSRDAVDEPKRENNKVNVKVHTNPDVKVLWNITSDLDLTKDVCSCVIDCEVVKYDPMEIAEGIVARAKEREANGENLLPRIITNKKNRTSSELEQENKDGVKLSCWKLTLKGNKNGHNCPDEVIDYLETELPGWRDNLDEKAIEYAKNIVQRAKERESNGLNLLPRHIPKKNRTTPELEQENKDAKKLVHWKKALNGDKNIRCSPEVRDYLDLELPGWRVEVDFDEKAMDDAKNIVARAKEREANGFKLVPRKCCKNKNKKYTKEEIQEHKDAIKLGDWKKALKGNGKGKCCNEVKDYLDLELPGWRDETDFDKKAMEYAQNIVVRAKEREVNGLNLLPSFIDKKNKLTPELEQEYRDATKLGGWKKALKGKNDQRCSDEVRDYLDLELPGWRDKLDEKSMENAKTIVARAKKREANGGRLFPRELDKKNRTTKELEQEYKDACKLGYWKKALKERKNSRCSNEIRDYLDAELPGWRDIEDTQSVTTFTDETFEIVPKKKSMKLTTSLKKEKETTEKRRARNKSQLSELHKIYKTMKSNNLNQLFHETPDLWHQYHAIAEENEQSFPEDDIPRNRIIEELNQIKTKRTKLVVDMGCGKAHIANYFKDDQRFQFINYDHVTSSNMVTICDISNLPLDHHSVEICILSLAMWGSNCEQYVEEAYRVLESGGKLFIIEPTKRWSEKDEADNIIPGKEGAKLKLLLEKNNFKILNQSVEKFSLFVCVKN